MTSLLHDTNDIMCLAFEFIDLVLRLLNSFLILLKLLSCVSYPESCNRFSDKTVAGRKSFHFQNALSIPTQID